MDTSSLRKTSKLKAGTIKPTNLENRISSSTGMGVAKSTGTIEEDNGGPGGAVHGLLKHGTYLQERVAIRRMEAWTFATTPLQSNATVVLTYVCQCIRARGTKSARHSTENVSTRGCKSPAPKRNKGVGKMKKWPNGKRRRRHRGRTERAAPKKRRGRSGKLKAIFHLPAQKAQEITAAAEARTL